MVLVVLTLGGAPSAAEAVLIVSANQDAMGQSQTQTGRLSPDGTSSQCAPIFKFSPSLISTGSSFSYVNHTFRSSLDEPVCVTVDVDTACSSLFSVAYIPSFTPANPLENYAADMGTSSGTPVYSLSVPGGSPFALVVHETATSPSCGAYVLNVSSRGPWAQSRPSIGGTPSVGSILSGSNANWLATPIVQQRWMRCDTAGANCSEISGTTGATYTVTDADLGHTIRFRNDATDLEATNTSDSPFVEPFIPFETHAGESLGAGDRVHNGLFVRNNVESRCAVPTSAPAVLQPMSTFLYDVFPVGSLMNESVCLVARTAPACGNGVTPTIYSPAFAPASGLAANYAGNSGIGPVTMPAAVSSILPAGESRELIVSQGSSAGSCASYGVTLGADAPFASVRPGLSGDPVEGGTLTASDGAWSGTPAITTSWRRCDAGGAACEAIPGATGASYTPTSADVGGRVRARVTATQGRSVSSDSQPSGVIVGADRADRTGPQGTIRLGSRNLRKAVKSGRIPVRTTCNEACSVALELKVTRKLARRLKLGKKVVIARVRGAAPAGRATPLRAKLTRRARRALRTRRSLRLTIAAALTDAAGNRTRVTKKASLQRPRRR
jgi:hypothetical protein